MIKVWIDGSCRPNPGKGAIGVVIRGGMWDYTISEPCSNRCTSNVAEYRALIRALHELKMNSLVNVEIVVISDSEMLVDQMNGNRLAERGGYLQDYLEAVKLSKEFLNIKFQWVSRDENSEANLLASRSLR